MEDSEEEEEASLSVVASTSVPADMGGWSPAPPRVASLQSLAMLNIPIPDDLPLPELPYRDVPLSDLPFGDIPIRDLPLGNIPLRDLPLGDRSLTDHSLTSVGELASPMSLAEETTLLTTAPLFEHLQYVRQQENQSKDASHATFPLASPSTRHNPLMPPLWPDVLASVLGRRLPSYVAGLVWRSRSLGDMHKFGFNMCTGSLLGWQDIYKVYGSTPISTDDFHEEKKDPVPSLTEWYDKVQVCPVPLEHHARIRNS